jgi:hypothetical protein
MPESTRSSMALPTGVQSRAQHSTSADASAAHRRPPLLGPPPSAYSPASS